MFVDLDTSKMKNIIYRQDFHNLQARKKMVQTTEIELSIKSNTARSQI